MAVTAKWYGRGLLAFLNKEVDVDTDDVRLVLLKSTYTPDQDAHDYLDDLVLGTNEVAPSGSYTANGVAISSISRAYDGPTNTTKVDGVDWEITNFAGTFRYAAVYDRTPASDATRPLLGYVDFGADQVFANALVKVIWHPDGIFTIEVD